MQAAQRIGISGSARALAQDRAVPLQAQGLQGAKNLVGRAVALPRRIEILDAHPPLAMLRACVQIAADGRNQGAEMKFTRGGGREAPAVEGKALARPVAVALTRSPTDLFL